MKSPYDIIKKPVLTDNRSQNKKPVLTDNKSSEKKSMSADGRNDKKPVLTDNKPHYNKNKQEPRKQEYPSFFAEDEKKSRINAGVAGGASGQSHLPAVRAVTGVLGVSKVGSKTGSGDHVCGHNPRTPTAITKK